MSDPRVGVLYSRVRVEEKLLFEAFERRGVTLDLIDDQKLIFDLTDVDNHPYKHFDVIVERCINHSRALYSLKILNDQGVKTVNTALCADICGNKLMTTSALLERNKNPSEQEIREAIAGNLCRCTGYVNIIKAVQYAAELRYQTW